MDAIGQIKALYSSLIEGIIPKAEEILERIVGGGQVIIDVDWDTFTDCKNELFALQTLEENVFKHIIRSMHQSLDSLEKYPIYDIRIMNVPGSDVSLKKLEIRGATMTYCGVFEAGVPGCLTEEDLTQKISGRASGETSPTSPSLAPRGVASPLQLGPLAPVDRGQEVLDHRKKRRSTIGKLKDDFKDILRAEIMAQMRLEMAEQQKLQQEEEMMVKVREKEKEIEARIKQDMVKREMNKFSEYQNQPVNTRLTRAMSMKNVDDDRIIRIQKYQREINEKTMEIEIEEREGGDESLISMMRTQLEIMKGMLSEEERMVEEEAFEDKMWDEDEDSGSEGELYVIPQKVTNYDIYAEQPPKTVLATKMVSSTPPAVLSTNRSSGDSSSSPKVQAHLSPALASANSNRRSKEFSRDSGGIVSPVDRTRHNNDANARASHSPPPGVQMYMIAEKEVFKQGFLSKRGDSYKSWKRRWFVLKKKHLQYYKAREYPYPQGTITQIISVAATIDEPSKKDYTFVISTPTRNFFCHADSDIDMRDWIRCIEGQIDKSVLEPSVVNPVVDLAAPIPHAFSKSHFDAPTKCMYCNLYIWGIGKQGFLCKVCDFTVHKKCISRVGDSCRPKTHLSPTSTASYRLSGGEKDFKKQHKSVLRK